MKKYSVILSAAMAALMLLLIPLTAAAEYTPKGSPVATAEEWAAMSKSGTYYLTADITLSATITGKFTGTVSGCGHTITTSKPLFSNFSGTIRDLTINGDIQSTANAGVLSNTSEGLTAWNVTNNANLTVSKSGQFAAGFVAFGRNTTVLYFYNCTNNGKISVTGTNAGQRAAGFMAYGDGIEVWNCTNNGTVTAAGPGSIAGGFAGLTVVTANGAYDYFDHCRNTADITAVQDAAGICAYTGTDGNIARKLYTFNYCENNGNITGSRYAGGIAGYGYGTGGAECFILTCCVNTGAVKSVNSANGFASQLAAYCNTRSCSVTYCVAAGSASADGTGKTVFLGCSSAAANWAVNIHDNYYVEGSEPEYYSYAVSESNAAQRITAEDGQKQGFFTTCSASDAADGTLCMLLNRRLGYNIFNQNLGTDKAPSPCLTASHVVYDLTVEEDRFINSEDTRLPIPEYEIPVDADAYYEETEPAATEPVTEPVTEAPETASPETEAPAAEKTGCHSCAAAAIIILLPAAFVFTKKH